MSRWRWVAVGVGASVGVQVALSAGVLTWAVLSGDSAVQPVPAPGSTRWDVAPPWTVGTCLREGRTTDCAGAHDQEVVSVVAASDRREGRRRWAANSSCARSVAAVVDTGAFAPDTVTYASAFPGDDAFADGDDRVFCLLVAADDVLLDGSWTLGTLQRPEAPLPLE